MHRCAHLHGMCVHRNNRRLRMNRKIKKRKERRFNVYNPSNNNNKSRRRKRRRKKNSNSDDDENGKCNQSSLQPPSWMSADAAAAAAAIAASFLTNILDPFIKQSTFHRLSAAAAAAAYRHRYSNGGISSISLIWHILYSNRTPSASNRKPLGNYPIYFILHYRSQVIWNGMLRINIGRERER